MTSSIQARIRFLICAGMTVFAFSSNLYAQDIYWTPEAKASYEMIRELRIQESLEIIKLQAITFPENLIWPYLEDYALFMKIFVREDLKEIPGFLDKSTDRVDRVSAVPESNPMSLMCQAQMHLHQCALRLQQNQVVAAATDINRAFKLLKKNQKSYPDDYANLRLYASLKIIFGSIPDQYRWLVSMVSSLRGTIDEGIADLNNIIQNSDPVNNIYYKETVLMAALAEGRINNKPVRGLELITSNFGKIPENKLVQYVMASLYIANGENDAAIKTLTLHAGAPTSERLPYLDFLLGKCKLSRGDEDADIYFKNFLLFHKGVHFIKEAHQKLGWYHLMRGDRNSYFDHMQLVKLKGKDETDEDKQALREAATSEVPHPDLLRGRLFLDGGYYEKAGNVLNEKLYKSLTHRAHRLEYLYRKGRLLHAQRSYAEALHYYNLTIRTGEYEPYYYACSAAYHAGLIHETLGSEEAAERYYLICLQTQPESYATSLHQKARTGLSRMGR